MLQNPFDLLDARLQNIEGMLIDLRQINLPNPVVEKKDFKYTPIQEIFRRKICSKATFYAHLKAGKFKLYKLGNRSFVDMEEFTRAFHKIDLSEKKGGNYDFA